MIDKTSFNYDIIHLKHNHDTIKNFFRDSIQRFFHFNYSMMNFETEISSISIQLL